MAESVASSRGFNKAIVSGLAGISLVAAIAACSSESNKKHDAMPTVIATTSAVPTTVASAPKPTPVSQADLVQKYVSSPARNERISIAVHGFGEQVLKASENPANTWAPFDAYCSQPNGPFSNETWTSKGYVPKSGDDCDVQHNPQCGGLKIQIDADVVVGLNGRYTDTFKGAVASSPGCTAIADNVGSGQWEASVPADGPIHSQSADSAKTLAAAKAIDDLVVNCLNTTTYK